MLEKIVSGGQTGVDRAALDAALSRGFPCGGWCPQGRRAEDGPIDLVYPLIETPKRRYFQRTQWNVRDSDGTLILATGELIGGTLLTCRVAEQFQKPLFRVDFSQPPAPDAIFQQLLSQNIRILNVAGPRESTQPGVYSKTLAYVGELLELTVQHRREEGR